MLSLILIIIASLLPLIVTWITSPEEIFLEQSNQKRKPIFQKNAKKKITNKGLLFIITAILTSFFATLQYTENQKDTRLLRKELKDRDSIAMIDQKRRDSTYNSSIKYRDSINEVQRNLQEKLFQSSQKELIEKNQVKIDSTNRETIELLAKYNFKVDSTQGEIKRIIRDSSAQASDIPFLRFCMEKSGYKVNKDSGVKNINLRLCNTTDFPAHDINIEVFVLLLIGDQYFYLEKIIVPKNEESLANNALRTIECNLKEKILTGTLCFFAYGKFKNSFGREFNLKSFTWYDVVNDKFISRTNDNSIIFNFLKGNGVIK